MTRRCLAIARRESAVRRIATSQRWALNSRNWRRATTKWVSESEGNGARNDTASREKTCASRRHCAGVPEVTGIVIAGYPLYAGAVICFSALPSADDDPPHPPSRRADRSVAAEDLLTAREGKRCHQSRRYPNGATSDALGRAKVVPRPARDQDFGEICRRNEARCGRGTGRKLAFVHVPSTQALESAVRRVHACHSRTRRNTCSRTGRARVGHRCPLLSGARATGSSPVPPI